MHREVIVDAETEDLRGDRVLAWAKLETLQLFIDKSPGPCSPGEAGISKALIQEFGPTGIPILGVCLGHQCMAEVYGDQVVRAKRLMHGKTSEIHHDGNGVFAGLPNPFTATRYHSLVVPEETLTPELIACAGPATPTTPVKSWPCATPATRYMACSFIRRVF